MNIPLGGAEEVSRDVTGEMMDATAGWRERDWWW